MSTLHVEDFLKTLDTWDGMALGWDAMQLYRFLIQFPEHYGGVMPTVRFKGDVLYTESFFCVLLALVCKCEHAEWFADVLGASDIGEDPELRALCESAVHKESVF